MDVATRQPLTFVGLGDAGFNRDGFFVLQEPGGTSGRTRIPFEDFLGHPGRTCPEIVAERTVSAVPHLLAMVNLVALGKDVLPLHASAFTLDGLNVLVTGWSKGGKTEALLAAMARGASYVGDEWVYLTPTREMLGLPEPMRVWDWHLEQFPDLRQARPARDRFRLSAWRAVGAAARAAGTTGLPGAGLASRVHPLAARQANLRVPPRDLFGTDRLALRAPLDATVLLLSHSSPEITVELVEQAEVARRMAASLVEERARFLAHYRQFRFAFAGRSSPVLESAAADEARLLTALFGHGHCAQVSHPSPCDISSLGDAVLGAATRLAGHGYAAPHFGVPAASEDHGARGGYASTRLGSASRSSAPTVPARAPSPRLLETAPLPAPVKRIYMGVNLEASSLMLPTTRLLVSAKRRARRSTRPRRLAAPGGPRRRPAPQLAVAARGTARMVVWVLEEWLRQGVAWRYTRAGYLVVFDRHFLADHYHSDIEPRHGRRGAVRALHGWMLQNAYPKPDLVLCLDAPGSVLFARKPESSSAVAGAPPAGVPAAGRRRARLRGDRRRPPARRRCSPRWSTRSAATVRTQPHEGPAGQPHRPRDHRDPPRAARRVEAGPGDLREAVADAEVVVLPERSRSSPTEVLAAAPGLRAVIRAGSGPRQHRPRLRPGTRGSGWSGSPACQAPPVAELTFALLLALARNVTLADRLIREGEWPKPRLGGPLLRGKTLGVVGAGNIGGLVGQMGHAWGMQVLGCVARPSHDPSAEQLAALRG